MNKVKLKKSPHLRTFLKKKYKEKKYEDAINIGCKINDLVQSLHLQQRLEPTQRDEELIERVHEELNRVGSERRFKDDFPDFPSFYNYIVDNGFMYEELTDL